MKLKSISKYLLVMSVAMIFGTSCQQDETLALRRKKSFKALNTGSVVQIITGVKIAVGKVVYENLDAHIRVNGYDAENNIQWTHDYNYVGPIDTLEAKTGFHHYSIELVDKWGINDIQSEITADDIWEGRADGPLPTTYVLGGAKQAKKISMYVTSHEVDVAGVGKIYQTDSRVLYTYNAEGQVEYIHHELYNPQTLNFERVSTEAFTFEGLNVSKIVRTSNGQPDRAYDYEYGLDFGRKNKITEINFNTGITTTQLIEKDYQADHPRVKVDYLFSNGRSILYEFEVRFKNIVRDVTVQGGIICNLGDYAYDKNINPFAHLGYTDINLQNFPASNKLSNRIDYLGCEYTTLFPLFYYYTYDDDGYPVTQIALYKSGANQNYAHHTKIDFSYQ